MLLNNFRPDKDDVFYFIYRFALRSWLLFLTVLFSYPIADVCGQILTSAQFLKMCGAFVLMVAVDFLSVWIKAYPIYKERERVEWENWGHKKTH